MDIAESIATAPTDVIGTAYEADVARYWDTKQDDAINLLLGEEDGLIHHHYGVGDYDPTILDLPEHEREAAILAEMHRLENAQTTLILDGLGALQPTDRVMDAGSGRGGTSFMVHDRFGCFVDGVTISRYQVDFATRLAGERGCADQVRFHYRNMLRTGFPAGQYAGVVTNETTMYVDLTEAFSEFARILGPKGRYVCVTWCINDAVDTPRKDIAAIDKHYGCTMHLRSRYFAALARAGLTPISVLDLTEPAIPYWDLRTKSAHRTGIEEAFLSAYRSREANFLLIVAEKAAPAAA